MPFAYRLPHRSRFLPVACEVTKPETINYRTLRPERDGLFCERIFGPQRDWECACASISAFVTRASFVISAASRWPQPRPTRAHGSYQAGKPVSHIWYVKGVPSRLGLLLNVSPRNLERVLYFAQYIITHVDEDARNRTITRAERDLNQKTGRLEARSRQRSLNWRLTAPPARASWISKSKRNWRRSPSVCPPKPTRRSPSAALQAALENLHGKRATEAISLPWAPEGAVLVTAGESATPTTRSRSKRPSATA